MRRKRQKDNKTTRQKYKNTKRQNEKERGQACTAGKVNNANTKKKTKRQKYKKTKRQALY